jgi:copper chaperone CopZ
MNRIHTVVSVLALSASVFALAACSSGGRVEHGGTVNAGEEQGVIHNATAAEMAATHSRTPIMTPAVDLYVNGLGCPLCATSIDKQLERLPGVQKVRVDLSTGIVRVPMTGDKRPSAHDFSETVKDAGFTLVKIAEVK